MLVTQLCPTLGDPMDYIQPVRLLCPWDSPGNNTGVGDNSCILLGLFRRWRRSPVCNVYQHFSPETGFQCLASVFLACCFLSTFFVAFFPSSNKSITIQAPIAPGASSGVGRLEVRLVQRLVLNLKTCMFMFLEIWEQRENGLLDCNAELWENST